MYRGFELKNLKEDFFGERYHSYLDIGHEIFNKQKKEVKKTLNDFVNHDGSLDGEKMKSNWFPKMEANIFLSHSHSDEELIVAFAGWLKKHFDLKAFIDSCVWGYFMELQRDIDNRFRGNGKLDYNKVLYVASHVNMMLNTALMQMIDTCECVIFVNTPNSVKANEVVDKVVSPWIYSELGMTKLIKKKGLNEYRSSVLIENSEYFSELSIEYDLDTNHLTELNNLNLRMWRLMKNLEKNDHPLDVLYRMKKQRRS
ncbi:hypothetical protein [Sphingobacterium thalpophilum]|uniref:hypothetical protein n=1 Tax=Sphingobacterium thalpophilum TaxID=259 RepID=UPI003D9681F6